MAVELTMTTCVCLSTMLLRLNFTMLGRTKEDESASSSNF